MFGQLSGDIVPQLEIQPLGYSAVAAFALKYEGSGRSYLAQLHPVIDLVDQQIVSSYGNSFLTLRGFGLLPLDTIDLKGNGQLSADTAADLKVTASSFAAKNGAILTKVDLQDSPGLFSILVGGVHCNPVEFFWVQVNYTLNQQLSCQLESTIGIYNTTPGSRGILRQVYQGLALQQSPTIEYLDSLPSFSQIFLGFESFSSVVWTSTDSGMLDIILQCTDFQCFLGLPSPQISLFSCQTTKIQ